MQKARKTKRDNNIKSLISIAAIMIMVLSLYYISNYPINKFINEQTEVLNPLKSTEVLEYMGSIQPQVLDGFSEKPIEGAVIVIPEVNQSYVTGKNGLTERISLPILKDKNYEEIVPKAYGEVTLVVYKEGYIEYILLHSQVWETINKRGPQILLFPIDEEKSNEPYTIVESPHKIWVEELVEKFRPR